MKKVHFLADLIISIICSGIFLLIMRLSKGCFDFILTAFFFVIFYVTILILDKSGIYNKSR